MPLNGCGVAIASSNRSSETRAHTSKTKQLVPVESLEQYKSLTRNTKHQSGCFTHGTSDVAYLADKLLKECQQNQQMMSLFQQVQNAPAWKSPRSKRGKKKAYFSDRENIAPGKKRQKKRQKPHQKRRKRTTKSSSSSEGSNSSESWDEASDASSSN
ncbi:ORF3 [Torque teno virus]|uniref:ORF3 n=1 Tax=Torque teno virus TaxID=68887 RepID=X2IXA2_9VIRU|nr:ORF3 [Torque teno virus]AHN50433.1 ORF3 [Torque teno virus]